MTDVEGLPSPSKTFYVAAAAGGIWKTTNNGTTFQPIWTNERVVSMSDFAIAPSDANQIWAAPLRKKPVADSRQLTYITSAEDKVFTNRYRNSSPS